MLMLVLLGALSCATSHYAGPVNDRKRYIFAHKENCPGLYRTPESDEGDSVTDYIHMRLLTDIFPLLIGEDYDHDDLAMRGVESVEGVPDEVLLRSRNHKLSVSSAQPLRDLFMSIIDVEASNEIHSKLLLKGTEMFCIDHLEEDREIHPEFIMPEFDMDKFVEASPEDSAWYLGSGLGSLDVEVENNARSFMHRNTTSPDKEVVIAVIDSGCSRHSSLTGKLWRNPAYPECATWDQGRADYPGRCFGWNFIEDTDDIAEHNFPNRALPYGHGTSVASIIAGSKSHGLCEKCRLMCLKIMDTRGYISAQIKAIEFAVHNGISISNNSYGGYGSSQIEYIAMNRAATLGHVFITSAGNRGRNNDAYQSRSVIHAPSDYKVKWVTSVGAGGREGGPIVSSNWGSRSVDLIAPGVDVVAAYSPQSPMNGQLFDGYRLVHGTSFATPWVTATVGHIMSTFGVSATDAVSYLTCQKTTAANNKVVCGGHLSVNNTTATAAMRQRRVTGRGGRFWHRHSNSAP